MTSGYTDRDEYLEGFTKHLKELKLTEKIENALYDIAAEVWDAHAETYLELEKEHLLLKQLAEGLVTQDSMPGAGVPEDFARPWARLRAHLRDGAPTYPEGKLREDDDGELAVKIGTNGEGKVAVDFGKPVVWFGMGPRETRELAKQLWAWADRAEGEL